MTRLGLKPFAIGVLLFGGALMVSLLATGDRALATHDGKTYTVDRAGGQAFATDWCSHSGNAPGLGDYMWITSSSGSTTINVMPGVNYVDVVVHATGKYCSSYTSETSGASYTTDVGGIVGTQGYPANGAGKEFDSQKIESLNITGWGSNDYKICITLATYSLNPSRPARPSPSACSTLTINRIVPWKTSGKSLVGVGENQVPNVPSWTTVPGAMLHWRHSISASGGTTPGLPFSIGKSGFTGNAWGDGSAANNTKPQGTTPAIGAGSSYVIGWKVNRPEYSSYRVRQSDVGNTLCQWINWGGPIAYNNGGGSRSGSACVNIPYNFNLVPSIDPLGQDVGEQDGRIPVVSAKVTNSGPTKSYIDIQWQVSRIIVKPGGSINTASAVDDLQNGCAYYRNDCTSTDGRGSGEGDSSFGVKATVVRQLLNEQIGDLEVGTRLCYGLSIKAYNKNFTNASPNWRHSPAMCVIIGKKPKMQIWGGDLSVGRRFANDASAITGANIETSTSIKSSNTKTFGSWVEYGIFAPGSILGTGSAAGLAGQDGNTSSAQKDWSRLTFANGGHTPAGSCGGFGCFTTAGNMGAIPDVAVRLAPKPTTSAPQLSGSVSLDGRNDTYYTNGNLTITGGTITKGNSVVIKASGTVFIDGDIRYTTDKLNAISEIPQVVIIANNIQIKDSVTNVDAWLIASGLQGRIYTCGSNNFTQVLTSNTCKDKLTINGPVMAKKLFLTRTAGSGTGAASGDPAEVLNLRTDAYLWAINKAGGQGAIRTLKTTELAPRF